MNDRPSWRPKAAIETLRERARILADIRRFFDSRRFVEVQTPVLSRDVVVDRYIEPFPVELNLQGERATFWLQTSPEFAMKRLVAAGADAIYQIGPAFRQGEAGDRHNPEFTMLEWYRTGDSYDAGMEFLAEFSRVVLRRDPVRISFRSAFRRWAGIDPFSGRVVADELNRWMAEKIEPGLARDARAAIVYDFPADQAALAQVRTTAEGHQVAERFELFIDGVELANGYHELTDAEDLLRRNVRINRLRVEAGLPALPEDSQLIAAMREGLPPCCGVALGVDRLVMLLTGKSEIADVIPFDIGRA